MSISLNIQVKITYELLEGRQGFFIYLEIPEAYSQVQHIMLNIYNMSHKAFNLIDFGRNQELLHRAYLFIFIPHYPIY